MSVSVNGPKTPVTKGSKGIAMATLPNICKMPGPPAPFVPAPLPNIGKTGDKVKGYSKNVKVNKKTVAIKGASFCSMGDVASKGTGGGILSSNTHGPCKFISPGSMDVKFEGKNVHLLSDLVTNNGGPSGSPPNAATMMGTVQANGEVIAVDEDMCPICNEEHEPFRETTGDGGTRGEAQALATSFHDVSKALAMIGVVHCKVTAHKYARKSSSFKQSFIDVAADYHRSAASADTVLGQMQNRYGNNAAFNKMLERANHFYEVKNVLLGLRREQAGLNDLQESLADLSRNPPGSCAAQGALMLALEHDCTPAAMSEVLSAKAEKRVRVSFRDYRENRGGAINVDTFGPGDSVPPCETCNLLVPFLVCPNEENEACQTPMPDYCCGC